MVSHGREQNGRFSQGNAGGPGRPRRAVESEYLATLADSVSLDDWRAIVARAVADARDGDATARAWLSKHVLGQSHSTLTQLAADEAGGRSADHVVEVRAREVGRSVRVERYQLDQDDWPAS
jgi:hypothetical protein